jgi:hypothetical protein
VASVDPIKRVSLEKVKKLLSHEFFNLKLFIKTATLSRVESRWRTDRGSLIGKCLSDGRRKRAEWLAEVRNTQRLGRVKNELKTYKSGLGAD